MVSYFRNWTCAFLYLVMFLLVFNSFLETNLHLKFPKVLNYWNLPSGNLLHSYWKWHIYGWFTFEKIVIFHRVAREIHLFLGNIREFWVIFCHSSTPRASSKLCRGDLPPFFTIDVCLRLGIYQKKQWIPSGKRLHNYGKSPFSMGKSTINGPFSIAMLVYQRVSDV